MKSLPSTPQAQLFVETVWERDQLLSQARNDSVMYASAPLPLLMSQLNEEQRAHEEEAQEQDEELFNTILRVQQQNTLMQFRLQQSKEVLAKGILNESDGIERRIVLPPGLWMRRITRTVYSKKTNERVFDPIISDYEIERFDAIQENADRTRRIFVMARHWFAFVCAALNQITSQLLQIIIGVMKSAGD